MHIAYICADPGVPIYGHKGASVHVQEVVRALRRRAKVTLLATRPVGQPPADLADLAPVHLAPVQGDDQESRERSALEANGSLQAALVRCGPFDLVIERYSLWSYAGMAYARSAGVPGILEVNAPLIQEQSQHRALVNRRGAEQVAGRAFGGATALLAVSQGVARYLSNHPAARGKVFVVANGVNASRFRPGLPSAISRPADEFVVGFTGSLKPWHGVDRLVEAFAGLTRCTVRARLLIVGDGPGMSALQAQVDAWGLSKVTWLPGAVDPQSVPGWLAAMDVAVAPYPPLADPYFSPLKVYEYMASGLPVVASRMGQLTSLLEESGAGLLCPPGDAAALTAALERLCLDPALRRRLGRAGREWVLQRHTWDHVVERVLEAGGIR